MAFFSGLVVDQAGTGYTIQVKSIGITTVTTSAFSVTPAAATQLVVQAQPPATVTAGTSFGLSFAVADSYGNVEPSFSGPVTIVLLNDPDGGVLNGSNGPSASITAMATDGVAAFSGLSIDTAAVGYTIEAFGDNLPAVTTNAITIVPAATTKLAVLVQPPSQMPEARFFGLQIEAEDKYGNRATSFAGDVVIALTNPASDRGFKRRATHGRGR